MILAWSILEAAQRTWTSVSGPIGPENAVWHTHCDAIRETLPGRETGVHVLS
jgi:hypothetical protein